jgi:hypothetical protein
VFSKEKIISTGNFEEVVFKPAPKSLLTNLLMKYLPYKPQKHKSDIPAEKEKFILKKDLPGHFKAKKEEVLVRLNEDYMPQWEKIKDKLLLFRIEEFATGLIEYANEIDYDLLRMYAQQLKEQIEIADVEEIKRLMQLFPVFIEKIKNKK